MKVLSLALLLMASIAFVMLGCSDNPESVVASNGQPTTSGLAKSSVIHDRSVIPIDYISPDPAGCLPGMVHVSGYVAVVTQLVNDANGDLKLSAMHYNITHLTLTTESGLEYNINEVDKELHTYVGANTVSSLVNAVAIGPPGELQIKVKIFTHMTWTPNGDVTGIVEKITFVCE
jgi:hypothetical protein